MSEPISRRHALGLTSAFFAASCIENKQLSAGIGQEEVRVTPGIWSPGVALPFAAQEIYPCAHDGALHLAGGFIAENGRITGPTRAHRAWKPDSDFWAEGVGLPTPRHHPQLISWKGSLFAFAGFESPSENAVWRMQSTGWRLLGHIFPPEGPSITVEPAWVDAPELPEPCGEAVTGITGDDVLHLAGGRTPNSEQNTDWTDHGDSDHHFVLTEINGSWERAAPCLSKRNSAAGDVIDGNLHIVGGRTVNDGNVTSHEVYDHREDRWRTAAPMPKAQGGLAAAAVGEKLYVFGGEYFDNGGGVYPESWVYSASTDTWDALPSMPNPRHGLGAVALDNRIYVIGGALEVGGNQTSAIVDIFDPA
ncbi:MAG: kelch repeat-containing protein [Pseudomonadota bacterium]